MTARSRRRLALVMTGIAAVVVMRGDRTAVPTVSAQEVRRAPVEQTVTARKYSFSPSRIEVQEGDIIKLTFQTDDIPHSFTVDRPYLIAKRATPGQPVTFEILADKAGAFTYYCNLAADDGCKQMKGTLVVHAKPSSR